MPRTLRIFDPITAAILPETDGTQQREAQTALNANFAASAVTEAVLADAGRSGQGFSDASRTGANLNGATRIDADLSDSDNFGQQSEGIWRLAA
jgi:uncharacterized protein YjbI with pentapeptide repeats